MNVCLFGGSFDPVHEGHLAIARRAVEKCGLGRVVFLPCARSPLKKRPPLLGEETRLRLLAMALEDVPWAAADPLDLTMPSPSWTWRLVEEWKRRAPGHELFWLMGCDQWKLLDRWRRADYLARELTFIVHRRGNDVPESREGVRSVFVDGEHPASSSSIREFLTRKEPIPPGWLNPAVESELRRLFRAGGEE